MSLLCRILDAVYYNHTRTPIVLLIWCSTRRTINQLIRSSTTRLFPIVAPHRSLTQTSIIPFFDRLLSNMSLSTSSITAPVVPPRPNAPTPPDPPLAPERPQSAQLPPRTLRKRLRSATPVTDSQAPVREYKRLKGPKGDVKRDALAVVTSRESSVDLGSESERPSSVEPHSLSDGRGSALSLTSPLSPTFPTTDLRATPISRSVIWNDRAATKSNTPDKPAAPKIRRFTPQLQSDLIIRSNDTRPVSFHVDTDTVFDASPVMRFRAAEIGTASMRDSRPVVVLSLDEPAERIRDLLCLIYVHKYQPAVTSSDELDTLLGLATRYRVAGASHTLCSTHLRDLAVHEPLRAYGLACKHNLHSEKAWTAVECLRVNLAKADVTHDLASCTPDQIRSLVQMHARRGAAACNLISAARTFDEFTCSGTHCEDGVAEWWLEVIKQSKAELTARPSSAIAFSPIFLAGCVRVAGAKCPECPLQFLGGRTQHRLMRLKDDIDALPFRI